MQSFICSLPNAECTHARKYATPEALYLCFMVPQSRHVGPNEASNRELCYACTFRADASRMNRTATGRAVKCLELHKASLPFHPLICPLAALRSLAFHFHPFESNRSHFLRNGSRSRSKAFFFSSSKGKQVRLLNSSLLPQPRCLRYMFVLAERNAPQSFLAAGSRVQNARYRRPPTP